MEVTIPTGLRIRNWDRGVVLNQKGSPRFQWIKRQQAKIKHLNPEKTKVYKHYASKK